jgi:hypothetical protein
MNKNRLNKLEKSLGKQLQEEREAPAIWRPEGGRIAIQESPFILQRLEDLGREAVYSPLVFTAVLVDRNDRDIVKKVEGRYLYLKGLATPIQGMPEIKFIESN